MAKAGARINRKTIAKILRTHDGGKRAAAERILARMNDPEAFIQVYQTDREVVGVVVPADKQAKDGIATKAANAVGIREGRP